MREPRGKQAGVNGKEWERQGYWGPSPGLRPPSPRGRGVGFGSGSHRPSTLSQRERGWVWGGSHRPSATLSQRERGWIWDGSHRPSATCETGCVKTPVPRYERPIRHSRESGNPGVLEGTPRAVSPLHPAWIPAFQAVSKLPPLPLGEGWGEGTSWQAGRCQRQRMGAAGLLGALTRPSATLSQRERGWVWDGSHRPSATCETGCVKTPVPRYERPIRHSRESGNPGVLEGTPRAVSPLHPAWIPAYQAVSNCPLSLWERVGVREPRGKQAGVNGK